MEKETNKKNDRRESEAQKDVLRFLRDEEGVDHKTYFDNRQNLFGSLQSEFRAKCDRYFWDTRRRVRSNPEKWKALLAKHGLDNEVGKMAPKPASKTKKRHDSDDDDDDSTEGSGGGEEVKATSCVFVGSPTLKKQQQPSSQKKAAKNKETCNDRNGEWSGAC
jgi:hypothetical protein